MPVTVRVRLRCASILTTVLFAASTTHALATSLSVMNWNMGNLPNATADDTGLATILNYAGASHPIDVLAMVETDTASGPRTAADFTAAFGSTYAQVMAASDGGGDRTGFVYNTSTLELLGTSTVAGITHPSLRAQFRPVGTIGAEDFYYYAVHLQSGSTTAIKAQRVSQAEILRADADALGSANLIFGGDFNWQKADDVSAGVGAYRTFNAAGEGRLFDPVDQVGDWHGNEAYKLWHTNDPSASMDDRFDMQLISGELTDGVGLDYVPGSYRIVGNNGTHTLGSDIGTGTGAPVDVLNALEAFSDHLPVMARYSFVIPEPAAVLGTSMLIGLAIRRRRPLRCGLVYRPTYQR